MKIQKRMFKWIIRITKKNKYQRSDDLSKLHLGQTKAVTIHHHTRIQSKISDRQWSHSLTRKLLNCSTMNLLNKSYKHKHTRTNNLLNRKRNLKCFYLNFIIRFTA